MKYIVKAKLADAWSLQEFSEYSDASEFAKILVSEILEGKFKTGRIEITKQKERVWSWELN